MTVTDALAELVAGLTSRTPHVEVLIATAQTLALEVDMAQLSDEQGRTKSAASAVRELRAVVDELMEKGRADGQHGEDWSAPAAATVGAATLRDISKRGSGNVRSRGDGGRKAAG